MAGEEYMKDVPFRNVYFTGIVRDKLGRKMSKSLGNSPDPLQLIDQYGADGVRMGMLLAAPAGNDILFDEALCQQGLAFCNKIWNAFRLTCGWETCDETQSDTNRIATEWMEAQIKKNYTEIEDLYSKYRLSEALMTAFKLFTDEFSGWYLEMVKPAYQKPIDKTTYQATLKFFDTLMKIIHPFMPFITEEIWQHIYSRKEGESIMNQSVQLPALTDKENQRVNGIETAKQSVAAIRALRNQKNIAPKETLVLEIVHHNPVESLSGIIRKMANLSDINVVDKKSEEAAAFMVSTTEYAVPLSDLIDTEAEIKKVQAQLDHLRNFLASIEKKLNNEKFIAHAPEQVIALERKKKTDSEIKIAALEETLAKLHR